MTQPQRLRIVRDSDQESMVFEQQQEQKDAMLRKALDCITEGRMQSGNVRIIRIHEAEVLFRVLRTQQFDQEHLNLWVEALFKDHPLDRPTQESSDPRSSGLLDRIFGGRKPGTPKETVEEWMRRARLTVDQAICDVGNPVWITGVLTKIDATCAQVDTENSGKMLKWSPLLLYWVTVQFLMVDNYHEIQQASG